MTDATEALTDAQAAAEKATTPATFNFAEAILDRSYPTFEVPVFLDEAKVTEVLIVANERDVLEDKITKSKNGPSKSVQAAKLAEVQERYDGLIDELNKSKYVFTVRGVSNETLRDIENDVYMRFPREYDEEVNNVTGATVKTEKENEAREEEFAMLIRRAHLVSATSPDGATDTDFSDLEKVRVIFTRLPQVARAHLDTAIQNCTLSVDYYREIVNEVF